MQTKFEALLDPNLTIVLIKIAGVDDCENDQQMEKYYETARNFDESFNGNGLIPNCQHYEYAPHDYFSDNNYERLDSINESEINVVLTTFYKHVSTQYIHKQFEFFINWYHLNVKQT